MTNVGVAHMEVFGSWDAIVRASAEPVEALAAGGTAVLNADDPVVSGFRSRTGARVLTFGRAAGADVRAETVVLGSDGRAGFVLAIGRRPGAGASGRGGGAHGGQRACRGRRRRRAGGAARRDRARRSAPRRSRRGGWRPSTRGGIRVLNDAYNANPESMAAALRTADGMAGDGRVIAVLGQMAELGADRRRGARAPRGARRSPGGDAARHGGAEAKTIAVAATREGVEPENVAGYDDADAALEDVRAHARPATSYWSRPRASRGSSSSRRRWAICDPRSSSPPRWAWRSPCSARRSRSAASASGLGPADPRGRPAHAPGEDGHADDGRDRDARGARRRLPRVAARPRSASPSPGSLVLGGGRVRRRGVPRRLHEGARRRSLGLTKTAKFAGTAVVSIGFAMSSPVPATPRASRRTCRSCAPPAIELGLFFYLWVFVVLTASSNAVNLTDGLDGLAAGASILVSRAYVFIAFWQFRHTCALLPGGGCYAVDVDTSQDAAIVAAAMMGAATGFLWWNAAPGADLHGRHRVRSRSADSSVRSRSRRTRAAAA